MFIETLAIFCFPNKENIHSGVQTRKKSPAVTAHAIRKEVNKINFAHVLTPKRKLTHLRTRYYANEYDAWEKI